MWKKWSDLEEVEKKKKKITRGLEIKCVPLWKCDEKSFGMQERKCLRRNWHC